MLDRFHVIVSTLFVATSMSPSLAQWSSDTLDLARYDHAAAESGDRVYLAGGFAEGQQTTASVEVYDIGTGAWSSLSLSKPRWRLAAAVTDGIVAFAGGTEESWGGATDVVIGSAPSALRWTLIARR